MPTTTYLKLAPEKRQRILQAAIDEFAEYRFSEASINRIIKAAGIPRGSFYQYFSGKEDIYRLVIEHISAEKLAVFAQAPALPEGATFFEAAIASIPSILEWVERCPKYNRIGMLMAYDDSGETQRILGQVASSQEGVLRYLERDRERGLIRAGVDLQLTIDLLLPAITTLLRQYYSKDGPQRALSSVQAMLDIIAHGIYAGKEPV